jgi:hypothetical protein
MPTLISRQEFTIGRIVTLHEGPVRRGWSVAFSSIKRAHARAMTKAGYTVAEAWASVQDCVDMARLEILALGGNPALELG